MVDEDETLPQIRRGSRRAHVFHQRRGVWKRGRSHALHHALEVRDDALAHERIAGHVARHPSAGSSPARKISPSARARLGGDALGESLGDVGHGDDDVLRLRGVARGARGFDPATCARTPPLTIAPATPGDFVRAQQRPESFEDVESVVSAGGGHRAAGAAAGAAAHAAHAAPRGVGRAPMISSSAAKTSASLGAICPRSGLTNLQKR